MNGNMFRYVNKIVTPYDIEKELVVNVPIAFENPYNSKQWPEVFFGRSELEEWFLTLREMQNERKALIEKIAHVIEHDCIVTPQKMHFRNMTEALKKAIAKTEEDLDVSKWIGTLGPCWDVGNCCNRKNFMSIDCTTTKKARNEIEFIKQYDPVDDIPRVKGLKNDGLPVKSRKA